ncbi:threonine ammonia-lyase [Muricoccus aerilatus]|uniref:threonine ammonia-lyase n=1 Tax=Muricoccus aerilatus TaxID=452982 RepID=UPI0006937C57|nr:threonine/serine dehydratase [Roseomonas aerilata]
MNDIATTPWHLAPPSFEEIEEAAGRIRGVLVETPLLESERLNARLGGRLLVKAEGLQRTGSFKARGAWNRLSVLSAEERARGVVAFSSGNHAQAVAWAGRRLGIGTVVIAMPADAPAAKIERTRGWGAEVVLYDRATEDREALGRRLAEELGLILVPPYDDRRVIAGAGTLGREVAQQAAAMGATPEALLVCCAGGGLTAGCALALETLLPAARVFAVEPVGFDDTARSLAAGTRLGNAPGTTSICDAVLAPMPGALTFSINAPRLGGGLVVSDSEALAAMRVAFEEFGLVVEPGGAVALAAALFERLPVAHRTVAVALTGANVDAGIYRRALSLGD